ncbi:hypothetical protein LOT_1502 [Lentilactobacillus otakiensis DSM 19908 = JCM 15040]|uniref:Uncharacterized protein n=1 Tax=Lentilactobacillus otakiensis DSM 19908 = JCM 15040 TaxID=1423780 RepID=S4NDI5_9LACO|nr:hypothetical protein LOT_1502 [Lentilactobacillus otakiensis DSM 19908 = JCM 15040]
MSTAQVTSIILGMKNSSERRGLVDAVSKAELIKILGLDLNQF